MIMLSDQEKSIQQSRIPERAWLACELHDSLAQTLASVRYYIRNLDHAIQGGDECEIYELLEIVENNVEVANTELRALINRFRAPMEESNLLPAMENIIRKLRGEAGLNAVFQNRLGDIEFPPAVTFQVIRIAEEAAANIRKHAEADLVRVMLYVEAGRYHLLIEDDGCGFDPVLPEDSRDGHFGLKIMQERAAGIGGELDIDSAPGEGARIRLAFPQQRNCNEAACN